MGFLWSLLLMCGWMMYGAAKFWSQSCPSSTQPHAAELIHLGISSTTAIPPVIPVMASLRPPGTYIINKDDIRNFAQENHAVQVIIIYFSFNMYLEN